MFFSTVHHSIELFHQPTLMHNFLYSLTICLLHYYPRHVSSINMPIFRKKNCIHTASGIFALCKRLHNTLVESGLQDSGSPSRPVSSGLQVPGEMGHCRRKTRPSWRPSRGAFLSKCPSMHRQRLVTLRVDSLALWKIINEE